MLVELGNSEIVQSFGPSFLCDATLVRQTVESLVKFDIVEHKTSFRAGAVARSGGSSVVIAFLTKRLV